MITMPMVVVMTIDVGDDDDDYRAGDDDDAVMSCDTLIVIPLRT